MLFQALDDKQDCVGLYIDEKLSFHGPIPDNLSKTWSYSAFLKGRPIDYAQLYCEGKAIDDVCPDYLKEDWLAATKKLKSFIASCIEAKVSLKDNCFFDMVPKQFLIDYCYLKNQITHHVLSEYQKPKEYAFYKRFTELLHDIKHRELNIQPNNIKSLLWKPEASAFYKKINSSPKYISYNMFGTKTGRLTTNKESFPALTFPKLYRDVLVPQNDWFVVFDMNAAELRTALALQGKEQISGDFHEWTAKNVFNDTIPRARAKEVVTAWLYDSHCELGQTYNNELMEVFNKDILKEEYWVNGVVETPYNRRIEADQHHAISYLNQSTFIDLFHRQILKVDDYLDNRKSFISFLIHDEFVLDMKDEEKNLLPEIINILQSTPYGTFPVNIKAGKTYGKLTKIKI